MVWCGMVLICSYFWYKYIINSNIIIIIVGEHMTLWKGLKSLGMLWNLVVFLLASGRGSRRRWNCWKILNTRTSSNITTRGWIAKSNKLYLSLRSCRLVHWKSWVNIIDAQYYFNLWNHFLNFMQLLAKKSNDSLECCQTLVSSNSWWFRVLAFSWNHS